MPDGNGSTGGQAPTGSQATGQAPQANNGSAPQSGAPQGQAPDGNTSAPSTSSGQQQQQLSASEYERIIADLRKENASHRTGKTEAEKQLKTLQDAQLTDQQKRERDFTDMQTKVFEYEARLQTQALQLAGYRLGSQLGIGDISAALALVQAEHAAEIKYGGDGTPENISDLLKAVLKDHPVLAAQAQQPQRSAASSGGVVNPGTVARAGGTFTREQIARMSPREYEQNRAAIMEQLKSGGLRP